MKSQILVLRETRPDIDETPYLLYSPQIRGWYRIGTCPPERSRKFHPSERGSRPAFCDISKLVGIIGLDSTKTYVDGDDVRHCRERGQSSANLLEDAGTFHRVRLSLQSASHTAQ